MKNINKTRQSFSIRINGIESKMIDELKSYPYCINMLEFLRGEVKNLYCKVKDKYGEINKT